MRTFLGWLKEVKDTDPAEYEAGNRLAKFYLLECVLAVIWEQKIADLR